MCLLRCNSIADWLHSTGWREIGSLLSDTGGGAPLLGPSGSTEQVPHRCRRLPPPPSPAPPPLRPTIWPMDNYNDFFNTVHTVVWNGIQTRPLSQLTSITLLRDIGHLRSPAPISTLAPKLSSKLKIWKKELYWKDFEPCFIHRSWRYLPFFYAVSIVLLEGDWNLPFHLPIAMSNTKPRF